MKTREYIGKLTTGKWTRMTVLAIAAFIVPYIFAFNNTMLFIGDFGPLDVVQVVLTSSVGMFLIAAA